MTHEDIQNFILRFMAYFKSMYYYYDKNFRIRFNINTDIGFLLYFKGSFEKEELNICNSFLTDKSIVFDIGANIGLHSLYFSRIVRNGFVYSFEPSRNTYAMLTENLKNEKNILPLNFGIGKKTNVLDFYETIDNAYSSFKDTKRKQIDSLSKVLCFRLDEFVESLKISRIDFIKIDVEGLEQDVIDGMTGILSKLKPVIFCEIYGGTNSNLNPEFTINTICSFNYSPLVVIDGKLKKYENHSDEYVNYYFIPN